MLQNSSGTGFVVTVRDPVDPSTDPNWRAGDAAIAWLLDLNNDGVPDFGVALVADSTGAMAAGVVNNSTESEICSATPRYIAGSGYRVTVPAGCLPHLTTTRFGAGMEYTDVPHDPNPVFDFAPDGGLSSPVSVQERLQDGYWMLGADGHVYPFGGALGFPGTVANAKAMTPRHDGTGYWVVDRSGHVFSYGTARFFGGSPALRGGEFISSISATPSGGGYWLFSNQGRVFAFGNAAFSGDMSAAHLNGPIVASVATSSGKGYYLVGSDGGIFSFGDAKFHGSTGNLRLNKPIVGISPTADGKGYWLVGSDGGVFAFSAPFRGSMGAAHLNRPVDGLVAFGNGYLMAASDGGIFNFSNKAFAGSLGGKALPAPIIGLAAFSS